MGMWETAFWKDLCRTSRKAISSLIVRMNTGRIQNEGWERLTSRAYIMLVAAFREGIRLRELTASIGLESSILT